MEYVYVIESQSNYVELILVSVSFYMKCFPQLYHARRKGVFEANAFHKNTLFLLPQPT